MGDGRAPAYGVQGHQRGPSASETVRAVAESSPDLAFYLVHFSGPWDSRYIRESGLDLGKG